MPTAPAPPRSAPWRFHLAEAVSGCGDGVFWVSLIVALARSDRFELWLVLAVLARLGPRAFLGITSGRLVDSIPLRPLLVVVDLVRALLGGALAVLAATGSPPIWMLAVVLASYVVGVPTRPAMSVALTRLVAERELAAANARLSTIRQVMTFVGPLVGAGVASWSTTAGFVANALSFVVSALVVSTVRALDDRRETGSADAGARRPAPTATRGALARAGLLAPLTLVAAMYFVRGVEMVVHVLVIRDVIGGDPDLVGVLSGAIAVGAFLAIPIAADAAARRGATGTSWVAVLATAVPTAALAAASELWVAAALLVAVGAGMVVFEVVAVMTVQRLSPPELIGRSFSAMNGASNIGRLAGALMAPVLAEVAGTGGAVIATAVLLTGATGALTPALRRAETTATRRSVELDPIVRVLRSLGLFEAASQAALERMAASVERCDVAAGAVVVREGEPADDIYIVRRGTFTVTVHGAAVNEVRADEWFGEIGLVQRVPRTATVAAAADGRLWRIPGDVFLAALEDSGSPSSALLDGIADRLARGAA